MVSFIANPDIALAQEERRLSLAKMLQGYTPPQNPYGYTTAGVFAPLAHALSARWKGQEASRLQAQQQEAQAAILSGIREAALPQSGPFYETVDTTLPGAFPGASETRTQIQRIADDGSVLPPEISAETARTAGIDPLTLKAVMDDAMRTGDVATQEAIKIEASKRFQQAVSDLTMAEERGTPEEQAAARNMVAQWRAITDPSAAFGDIQAQDQLEAKIERDLEKEERGEIQRWTIDGQPIWLTKGVWRADQKLPKSEQLYTNVEPEKEEKPIRVRFVNPVNGITSGWVMPDQLREDMLLPVKDRQFVPPQGVSFGPDGNLIVTGVSKAALEEAKEYSIELGFKSAAASQLLKNVMDNPGLAGLRGRLADYAGGWLGLASPKMGEVFTEFVAGATPEELAAFKCEGNALIAGLITEMAGEESGRFSGPERDITKEALRVFQVETSPALLEGALRSALKAYAVHAAKASYTMGRRYRIEDKEWLVPYVKSLFGMGLNKENVKSVLASIKLAHQVMDTAPQAVTRQ